MNREELIRELTEARQRVGELEAVVQTRQRAAEELELRLAELSLLSAVIAIVNESLQVEEILERVLDEVLGKVGIESAAILLLDEDSGDLATVAHRNVGERALKAFGHLRLGEGGLGGRAARTGRPTVIGPEHPYFRRLMEVVDDKRIRAAASVPLKGRRGVIGALNLGVTSADTFDETSLDLLVSVGREIAVGVERARFHQEGFSMVAENANDAILMLVGEGTVAYANKHVADAGGYSVEELLGQSFTSVVHPDDLPAAAERFRKRIQGLPVPARSEARIIRKDGTVADCEVTGTRIEWRGRPAVLVIIRDVTEHKRTDEALRESEEKYRSVVENAPDYILIVDPDLRITYINRPRGEDFPPDKIVGSNVIDWAPPEDHDRIRQLLGRVFATGESVSFEQEASRPGGPRALFSARVGPIKTNDRAAAAMIVATDISGHRRAEEALKESEEKLRSLVENSPDIVFTVDADLRVTFINRTRPGLTAEDVIGSNAADWVPPEHRDLVRSALRGVFRTGKPTQYETLAGRSGETPTWYAYRAGPLKRDGRVVGAMVVATDITEQKHDQEERQRLERQFRQAQKMESLGVLAGGIAHDFNNLLAGVLGNADLALSELGSESPARHYVKMIEKTARRLTGLTRQMLAYSGRGSFVVGPVDLSGLVEDMARLLRVTIPKGVAITYHFSPQPVMVEGDASQIRQIVVNLMTNAAEAIGEETGAISVNTGVMKADRDYLSETYLDDGLPAGEYTYLEVTDTGCGMDEDTGRKMFDPFFTTKLAGRGFGLAATLGIVRGHRGAIKVHSEPGRGTTVMVVLPRWKGGVAAAEPAERPGKPARGGTILVADDEELVRSVTRQMLEHAGFRVLVAKGGGEVLDVLREHLEETKAVLLDLTMPGPGVDETYREIRRLRPDMPVILSSGGEEETAARFAGDKRVVFLEKPFDTEMLLRSLSEVLPP